MNPYVLNLLYTLWDYVHFVMPTGPLLVLRALMSISWGEMSKPRTTVEKQVIGFLASFKCKY